MLYFPVTYTLAGYEFARSFMQGSLEDGLSYLLSVGAVVTFVGQPFND